MASPTALEKTPRKIKVTTLNCWGLKYLSKYRHERLSQIGAELAGATPPPDVVGLQECWTRHDYDAIRDHTRHVLPHGKFYYGGIFGAGLAILSRWPIVGSSMHAYPLNGRPTAFFRGDWFVGKGVACASILLPSAQHEEGAAGERVKLREIVEVLCTHLHAPYEQEPNDSYLCHRTAQAWEIAKLMSAAVVRSDLVLGLGDFNMVPESLAHRIMEAHAPVRDVWRILHPRSSVAAADDAAGRDGGMPMPSVEFNLTHNGTTCDSGANTWRWDKRRQKELDRGGTLETDLAGHDPRAKRLDYIFAGNGRQPLSTQHWQVEGVAVGMLGRHPRLGCSLSDHFSVEATLSREPTVSSANTETEVSQDSKFVPASRGLEPNVYSEILQVTASYTARERQQRRFRLAHFGASLFISIACLVAVWWSPRNFVSFLLMLLSTLGLAAGLIDGLIGGLFMSSELRALKEFEWEIKNAKSLAETASKGQRGEEVIDHGA